MWKVEKVREMAELVQMCADQHKDRWENQHAGLHGNVVRQTGKPKGIIRTCVSEPSDVVHQVKYSIRAVYQAFMQPRGWLNKAVQTSCITTINVT